MQVLSLHAVLHAHMRLRRSSPATYLCTRTVAPSLPARRCEVSQQNVKVYSQAVLSRWSPPAEWPGQHRTCPSGHGLEAVSASLSATDHWGTSAPCTHALLL